MLVSSILQEGFTVSKSIQVWCLPSKSQQTCMLHTWHYSLMLRLTCNQWVIFKSSGIPSHLIFISSFLWHIQSRLMAFTNVDLLLISATVLSTQLLNVHRFHGRLNLLIQSTADIRHVYCEFGINVSLRPYYMYYHQLQSIDLPL